ncbi:transglutaminase-like domain-containing protein [Caenimonas terrae]|uniref:Transglutaminase-like domain-containing protein n=1 Tax=Caenimonas terrae TaxID=696074 RepID=A0ABW0NBF0_9BURK
MHEPTPDESGAPTVDDPGQYLGSSALLTLQDSRLRLRARSITQLCKTDRERAMALHNYVKKLPFARPFKFRLRTAREVLDAGRGDATDKSTLLVALLRRCRIPARIRYVELKGEILRGLTSRVPSAPRAVVEIWLHSRWVRTDTYIFDTAYIAAARQRLKDHDWEWGYGIHRNGQSIWNGTDDAFLGGYSTEQDPMVVQTLGVYHDPLQFVRTDLFRRKFASAAGLHWNLLSLLMRKAMRQLREEAEDQPAPGRMRKSP